MSTESVPGDSSQPQPEQEQGRWFPLESNPELMNEYIQKMGFDTSLYEWVDVLSTEDWALDMIAQPVAAVIFLYPLTPQQEQAAAAQPQTVIDLMTPSSTDNNQQDKNQVWFMKQRIGNACGTIGLLHALLNAPVPAYTPSSWLAQFAQDCPIDLSPVAKAQRLEQDQTIASWHDAVTHSDRNQTDRGNIDQEVDTHFVALVHVQGQLYELDGRQVGPIVHGSTTPETLLTDACRVIQQFMQRDPTELRFTILALAPTTQPTS